MQKIDQVTFGNKMKDSTTAHDIIRMSYDSHKSSLTFEFDLVIIAIIVVIIILLIILRLRFIKSLKWQSLEVEISGSPKAVFKVERNDENLFIANRIYIELTTRKAAISIDEKNDVLEEIYDSWHALFGIIRDELKSLPGKYLRDHDPTLALIGITRKILNDAMRPHLTEHQAKFRKWLESAKQDKNNSELSPQKLQEKYPDFANLIASMKLVNQTLIGYAAQLDKLIKGK